MVLFGPVKYQEMVNECYGKYGVCCWNVGISPTALEVAAIQATDKRQTKSCGDSLYVVVEPIAKGGVSPFWASPASLHEVHRTEVRALRSASDITAQPLGNGPSSRQRINGSG